MNNEQDEARVIYHSVMELHMKLFNEGVVHGLKSDNAKSQTPESWVSTQIGYCQLSESRNMYIDPYLFGVGLGMFIKTINSFEWYYYFYNDRTYSGLIEYTQFLKLHKGIDISVISQALSNKENSQELLKISNKNEIINRLNQYKSSLKERINHSLLKHTE